MWTLLTDTKKSSFRLWLLFSGICFLLVLAQSWSGRLNGILGLAWLCFFLSLGPGLILLLIALLRDRQSSLLISRTAHRVMIGLTVAYLLLVLGTLLGEAWVTQGKVSIQDYRQQSLIWVLPLQAILLMAYGILFWDKRNRIFQKLPLSTVAKQQADHWGAAHQLNKQQALEFIAKGETGRALELIGKHFRSTGLGDLTAITLLQAQWKRNEEQHLMGLLTEEEAQRNNNRQMMALIKLIEQT